MKHHVVIILLVFISPLQIVAQELEKNNHIGYGLGAGFGGLGVRYDYEALPSFLVSANLGVLGVNIGLRYKFCSSDKNNCLIGSGYIGENNRQGSDTLYFNRSALIGIDYQHYFTESWSYELGFYYLKYLEDNEFFDEDDELQISIGFIKSF